MPESLYELQNVLYVQTQGAMLHLDHDTVRIVVEGETKFRAPLLRLSSIVAFGQVSVSPFLIQRCAEDGRGLVWLQRNGRFAARVEGPMRGNVLLRRAQHLVLSDRGRTTAIARQIVAGKVHNSRQNLLRAAREAKSPPDAVALRNATARMAAVLTRLGETGDLNAVRGAEGETARAYFEVFGHMLRGDREIFTPKGRTRRPPRDPANSVLSFLYAILRADCASALEGVGLDPQVGFLHSLRPGRPALALDLMEEFRPILADRLALTLINRKQLRPEHFEEFPGGAYHLNEDGRRLVLTAWQQRKATETEHRVLKQKVPLGLVPHIQARLFARYLRNDLAHYPPFLSR